MQEPETIFKKIAIAYLALISTEGRQSEIIPESITLLQNLERTIPNVLGAPIKIYKQIFVMVKIAYDSPFKTMLRSMKLHLKSAFTNIQGIKVHNPVNNLWHGYQRLNTMTMNIPLSFRISLGQNRIAATMEITNLGNFGVNSFVEPQVFIEGITSEEVMKQLDIKDVRDYYVPVIRSKLLEQNVSKQRCNQALVSGRHGLAIGSTGRVSGGLDTKYAGPAKC